MLDVFAEFETNLRRERQPEGIAKAKAAGVYKARKVNIDPYEVRRLKAEGLGASEIAKVLKIEINSAGPTDLVRTSAGRCRWPIPCGQGSFSARTPASFCVSPMPTKIGWMAMGQEAGIASQCAASPEGEIAVIAPRA